MSAVKRECDDEGHQSLLLIEPLITIIEISDDEDVNEENELVGGEHDSTIEEDKRSLLLIEPHISIIEISDDEDYDEGRLQIKDSKTLEVSQSLGAIQNKEISAAGIAPAVTVKSVVTVPTPAAKKQFNSFTPIYTKASESEANPAPTVLSKCVIPAKKPCNTTVPQNIKIVTTKAKRKKKKKNDAPKIVSPHNSYAQIPQPFAKQNIPKMSFDVVDLSHAQGRIEQPERRMLVENALVWHFDQLQYQGTVQQSVSIYFAWKNGYFHVDCADEHSHQFLIYVIAKMTAVALWKGCALYVLPSGSVQDNVFNGRRCIVLYTNRNLLDSSYEFFRMLSLQNPQLNVAQWTVVHWIDLHTQLGTMYYFLVDCESYLQLLSCSGGVHFGLGQMLYFNLWPYNEMRRDSVHFQFMMQYNFT